ncbi:MAG: sulfate adenylyltransferase, partial [Nitrosopumilaceae archaeon]
TFTNERVCPHGVETRDEISGTKLREMIQNGKAPSEFILRPEVSKIIMSHNNPFVD